MFVFYLGLPHINGILVYVQYTDTPHAYVAKPLDSNFTVSNVLAQGNTKHHICKSKRTAGVKFGQ